MNNDLENLVTDWKEPERSFDYSTFNSLAFNEQQIKKQISFRVYKLTEQEYFEDFCNMLDLSNQVSAKLTLYLSDNFTNVKRCFAIDSADRAQIMSGFFVIDGMILDPYLEKSSFESLKLDQNSEIVLVTWSDEHYYSSLFAEEEQLWDNIFA